MKNKINGDFEKLILDGCKVINKQSVNYDSVSGDYSHILLECPKDYRINEDKERGAIKFISIEWGYNFDNPYWYESTFYYSTRSHANKGFWNRLTEDRISRISIKKNNLNTIK